MKISPFTQAFHGMLLLWQHAHTYFGGKRRKHLILGFCSKWCRPWILWKRTWTWWWTWEEYWTLMYRPKLDFHKIYTLDLLLFCSQTVSICCRIIYFANILYLGRGISKRNRAFYGFSLCEYLVGIWFNYNFVPATCNVLSQSSKDKVTTEITLASLSLIICNI